MTVIVGDNTYALTARKGESVYFNLKQNTDIPSEDFRSWGFTDSQGNSYSPIVVEEGTDPTASPNIYVRIDDCDFTATAKIK